MPSSLAVFSGLNSNSKYAQDRPAVPEICTSGQSPEVNAAAHAIRYDESPSIVRKFHWEIAYERLLESADHSVFFLFTLCTHRMQVPMKVQIIIT